MLFLFEAETFATDIDDGAAMEQSVERGGGHNGVAGEDFGPCAESFIGSEETKELRIFFLTGGISG